MTPKIKKWFDLARKLARKSPSPTKMGCVIVSKNRVIAVGFNDMTKTHPKSNHPWQTLHAEIDALIGLDSADKCDAYVFREHKNGRFAMAKPCPTCEFALRRAGVRRVYFTTYDGWSYMDL